MLMDAGLDTGEIVLQQRVAIERDETYGELHDRLAALGAQLLARCIALAECGELAARPQSGEADPDAPDCQRGLRIDLSWAPERIVRAVRAYAPQPAARAEINGEIVKILRAHVGDSGELVIDELIAPNRGKMSGATYLPHACDRVIRREARGSWRSRVVSDVFPANGESGRSAHAAFDYRVRRAGLSERDVAFAAELAYGAIKMRRTLDWYLDPLLTKPLSELPPIIRGDFTVGRLRARLYARRRTRDALRVRQPRQTFRPSRGGKLGQRGVAKVSSRAAGGAGARAFRRRGRVSRDALFACRPGSCASGAKPLAVGSSRSAWR